MVSYIVKGKSVAARTRLASLQEGEVACISAITEAEMLYGLAKIGAGEQRRRSLEWFVGRLKVYAWDREAAAIYGPLRAQQERLGQSLGPLDTQIAAHAIALRAVLVTNDAAFHRAADLKVVENWATDL